MPILTLQRQLREIGRIRTGIQQEYVKDGKTKHRPAKLETFRITSPVKELVDAAAEAYGGEARAWDGQWEVITEAKTLDIVIPPGQPVSQWMETWSGGGCLRRCDGVTEVLTMSPCMCPADPAERLALANANPPAACKATTRLNVMLPALPDLGVFRLESHGYYAAVELAGAADILVMATAAGRLIPARLRLEQREKKVPGKPTNRYSVPVIEFVETRIADLQQLIAGEAPRQLGPARAPIPALPATTLPSGSSLRGPDAVGRPVGEPTPEVAHEVRFDPRLRADSDAPLPPIVAPPRATAGGGRPLCGNPSAWDDGTSCNLAAGHLEDPRSPQLHRVLDDHGQAVSSWPAKPAA